MKNSEWKKSSFSSDGDCVEVSIGDMSGDVYVRNSNAPHAGTARFTPKEWEVFLKGAKAGEFD